MRKPALHQSFWNAIKGIIWMLRSERNFQLEVFALLINLFLIAYFKFSSLDAAIILLVCFAVLSLEILNTCVEKICDIIQPDFDQRIKIIKDIAAGSVMLMAAGSVIVALLIYPKYLY